METINQVHSLLEVRRILELAAVKMAAERRTLEDLEAIQVAQGDFVEQILDRRAGIEEDLIFHLRVVTAGKNEVLRTLFIKIIPDLLLFFNKTEIKNTDNEIVFRTIREHDSIIEHIVNQDEVAAEIAMRRHLGN